jgi:hypothetical protein
MRREKGEKRDIDRKAERQQADRDKQAGIKKKKDIEKTPRAYFFNTEGVTEVGGRGMKTWGILTWDCQKTLSWDFRCNEICPVRIPSTPFSLFIIIYEYI